MMVGMLEKYEYIKSLIANGINGLDLIVRIGNTMDFDAVWDEYNLIEEMSRAICVM